MTEPHGRLEMSRFGTTPATTQHVGFSDANFACDELQCQYEETCNSNVPVNMLHHFCIGIVAFITVYVRIGSLLVEHTRSDRAVSVLCPVT